jgi:hypothetical protein
VIVQGLQPRPFIEFFRDKHTQPIGLLLLKLYVGQTLYLQRQGALKHIVFRERHSSFDAYNAFAPTFAEKLGLDLCLQNIVKNPHVDDLEKRGEFSLVHDLYRGSLYVFKHPDLAHEWPVPIAGQNAKPNKRSVATIVYLQHYGALLADTAQASELGVPLIAPPDPLLTPRKPGTTEAVDNHVAALELPFMRGVPVERVLKLREEYAEEFDRFKYALRQAISEELAKSDASVDIQVSMKIRDEYITPALVDIDRRLRAAKRSMSIKVAQNVSIGLMAAGIGLVAGLPLLVSAGVAGAAASVTHLNRLVDERKDLSLSDLYFLWRVRRTSTSS